MVYRKFNHAEGQPGEGKAKNSRRPKSSPLLTMWRRIFASMRRPASYGMHIPKNQRPTIPTGIVKISPNGIEHRIMATNHLKCEKMRIRLAEKH